VRETAASTTIAAAAVRKMLFIGNSFRVSRGLGTGSVQEESGGVKDTRSAEGVNVGKTRRADSLGPGPQNQGGCLSDYAVAADACSPVCFAGSSTSSRIPMSTRGSTARHRSARGIAPRNACIAIVAPWARFDHAV